MRIVFLLRKTSISGGVRVVFEYANRLHDRGHDVYVVYPIWNNPIFDVRWKLNIFSLKRIYWAIKSILINLIKPNKVEWFPLKTKLLKVPTFNKKYIPKADIIVATRWETTYQVIKYPDAYGKKFYLIQHYENWCGPEDKVNLTYNLGLNNIVISDWIKNILVKKLNAKIEKVIPNGVDTNQFYIDRKDNPNKNEVRILMAYRNEKWKGAADGIKAFEIAKKACPNIKLVMFGPSPNMEITKDVEFHELPYGDKLRKIYNSCDIFIFTSYYEGFALPPMEAMACGCAVVTTDVGAVSNYAIKNETALVVDPHDINNIAKSIVQLVKNKKEREIIAKNGFNYIKKFNWDKSTDELEATFKKYVS